MKIIKHIIILIILAILLGNAINPSSVKAQKHLTISTNKSNIIKNEEVETSVYITDTSIATFTLEIYFDTTKLEFVSGPSNCNLVQNRVIYTWTSENGKGQDKIEVHDFKFKAIADGTASIIVTGTFYQADGKEVVLLPNNVELNINQTTNQLSTNTQQAGQEVSSDNTELQIFRLNEEGIVPTFDPRINDYYFVTDKDIKRLDVTAIPKNQNASVTITGNENLKMGSNTITITVKSEDKTKTTKYRIYVTKTNSLEKANTNLETLAVRQGTLVPEFEANITRYNIEIANDIQTIDMLAIPENINANVQIEGNGKMKIGDNPIVVTVTAEDEITQRKYEITVHRRSVQEEKAESQEQEAQAQRVSSILEEQASNEIAENSETTEAAEEQKKKDITYVVIAAIIGIIILVIFILIVKRNLKRKA